MKSLGAATWAPAVLDLTKDGDRQLAVPSASGPKCSSTARTCSPLPGCSRRRPTSRRSPRKGRLPISPPAEGAIALCEVQGYTWRALREAAHLARTRWDDPAWAVDLDEHADRLAARFDAAFWLPGHDFPALALDGNDRPVDLLASTAAHLLWSGILAPERERAIADRLLAPSFFTGWGLRTVATGQHAYEPSSYHNGSVWPHDTAIAIEGLRRAGFIEHSLRLAAGLSDAASCLGRLPELFSGLDRSAFPAPITIPYAASPQAWACAAAVVAHRNAAHQTLSSTSHTYS